MIFSKNTSSCLIHHSFQICCPSTIFGSESWKLPSRFPNVMKHGHSWLAVKKSWKTSHKAYKTAWNVAAAGDMCCSPIVYLGENCHLCWASPASRNRTKALAQSPSRDLRFSPVRSRPTWRKLSNLPWRDLGCKVHESCWRIISIWWKDW